MRSRPTRVLRGSERLADTSELELRQTAERGGGERCPECGELALGMPLAAARERAG